MEDEIDHQNWSPDFIKLARLPGINNSNLSCFANSMLQVMTHTPLFFNHLDKYRCDCEKTNCAHCLLSAYFAQVRTFFSEN